MKFLAQHLLTILFAATLMSVCVNTEADDKKLTDEQKKIAMQHFVDGSEAFNNQDYETAIKYFQRAFDIARSPEIIYNIGRCHEELGQDEDAIYHYDMYLRFYPDAGDADDAKHRINMIQAAGEVKRSPYEDTDNDEEDDNEDNDEDTDYPDGDENPWWKGLRLDGCLGGGISLAGPADDVVPLLPIEIVVHYPFVDWFHGTVSLLYTRYFDDDRVAQVEKKLGLFIGISGKWDVKEKLSVIGRFGGMVSSIRRSASDILWLGGKVGAGVSYNINDHWSIPLELVGEIGPIMEKQWSIQVEIYGLTGVEYTF